ncbi:MAG: hypothetical protein ACFB0B_15290 [Thermonemataceae bacterium]
MIAVNERPEIFSPVGNSQINQVRYNVTADAAGIINISFFDAQDEEITALQYSRPTVTFDIDVSAILKPLFEQSDLDYVPLRSTREPLEDRYTITFFHIEGDGDNLRYAVAAATDQFDGLDFQKYVIKEVDILGADYDLTDYNTADYN